MGLLWAAPAQGEGDAAVCMRMFSGSLPGLPGHQFLGTDSDKLALSPHGQCYSPALTGSPHTPPPACVAPGGPLLLRLDGREPGEGAGRPQGPALCEDTRAEAGLLGAARSWVPSPLFPGSAGSLVQPATAPPPWPWPWPWPRQKPLQGLERWALTGARAALTACREPLSREAREGGDRGGEAGAAVIGAQAFLRDSRGKTGIKVADKIWGASPARVTPHVLGFL